MKTRIIKKINYPILMKSIIIPELIMFQINFYK